ncbi:hypothetical protein C0Q70_21118 [Pomacea canaliculata]|uniref:Uncharacterized protein n=1 Tax=Pomacea canaliculata TaxID=400727 RepID=A0A2T7NBL9_POMCA|nr:hypothetical protein C0Q70_21118 [Pomacea canaliculata]
MSPEVACVSRALIKRVCQESQHVSLTRLPLVTLVLATHTFLRSHHHQQHQHHNHHCRRRHRSTTPPTTTTADTTTTSTSTSAVTSNAVRGRQATPTTVTTRRRHVHLAAQHLGVWSAACSNHSTCSGKPPRSPPTPQAATDSPRYTWQSSTQIGMFFLHISTAPNHFLPTGMLKVSY